MDNEIIGVGYRKLMVWQQAKALAVHVYQLTGMDLWNKDGGLRDQVRRAAVSVPSNIAEGDARSSDKDSIVFSELPWAWKRGQEPIAKWPKGCFALLVPDPFSKPTKEIGYLTEEQLVGLLSRPEPLGASIGALIRSRKPKP